MTIHVKVMSEETIKPSRPTPSNLLTLRASLIDQKNTPVLVPLIYFYSSKEITCACVNKTLDRLKGSLRVTLSVFYPLAGRFKDINHVDCNDEGVPYVQAKVWEPLKDVVHKAEPFQLDILLPSYGQEGYTSLLLAIQVNAFACNGIAIGVKMSHAVADGFSLLMFVNTWTSIANGKDPTALIHRPCFEVWRLFPPPPLQHSVNNMDAHVNQNPKLMMNRNVTKWFMFSEAKLNAFRSKLLSYINTIDKNNGLFNHEVHFLSIPMILSAFIWSRIAVACLNNATNVVPYEVFHFVNLRPRVSPPSDEQSYYFGNMIIPAIAKPTLARYQDKNSNNESLWYDFLRLMEVSIKKIISSDASFIRELKNGKKDLNFIMEHYERKRRGEIFSIGFSNAWGLPVYEADFGWGKPVWVSSATQMYKNYVMLMRAGPSSKDSVIYICLSNEDWPNLKVMRSSSQPFLRHLALVARCEVNFV